MPSVWYLDERLETGLLIDGASHFITADRLILATGAQERPMPLPGWQLPGVMTAGAGQILLKSAAMIPNGRVILAGSGPLLLLIAWQYLQTGVKIGAIIDTTPRSSLPGALPYLPRALPAFDYLLKGPVIYARHQKRQGYPFIKRSLICAPKAMSRLSR